MKKVLFYSILLLILLTGLSASQEAAAATMNDFCITPPFVVGGVKPNLLLMLDNSGSQYDLAYVDTTGTCSKSSTTTCHTNADCTGSGICNNVFCDDNSYMNSKACVMNASTTCSGTQPCPSGQKCISGFCSYVSNSACASDSNCPSNAKCMDQYPGYFDQTTFYTSSGIDSRKCSNSTTTSCKTDANCSLTNGYCTEYDPPPGNPIPSQYEFSVFSGTLPGGCTYQTPYLCITLDASNNVTRFVASGKFLNWLSASKMDIQKMVLTGGKYDTTNSVLTGESRGCVGSWYVKEVPCTDWIPAPTCPLSSSSLPYPTFGVRGDISTDIHVPSTGGTTRIDLFLGSGNGSNYNSAACQAAVIDWTQNGGQGQNSSNSDTSQCLNVGQTQSTPRTIWNHALQTCWSCKNTPCQLSDIGTGDVTRIEGNNECGALTESQMAALTPTDPMYVCLRDMNKNIYVGACYYQNGNGPNGKWDDNCVQQQFLNYCNGLQVGEVVDPSSGPATTSSTGNIPANLMAGGLFGQLGLPIRTFYALMSESTPPTGLIQQFNGQIRFGAMDFDAYGSKTECGAPYTTNQTNIIYTCNYAQNTDGGGIIAPGNCSTTTSRQCRVNPDCPSGESCAVSGYPYAGYVGAGKCSVTTGTNCAVDLDCPAGEKCIANVGDHTTGLINRIDGVQASTWTPFSELFYTAINYFSNGTNAKLTNLNSALNSPTSDFDTSKNPVQYRCQKNNVLIITDGMSTADLNQKVTGLVSSSNCGGSCNFTNQIDTTVNANINYAGSRNLSDLAYIAYQRKISDFSVPARTCSIHTATSCSNNAGCPSGETCISNPNVKNSDTIMTHVVFSGIGNSNTDETNPQILMQDTANYGGGSYQTSQNSTQLQKALNDVFQTIATGASSGTAASVLASGEGSGANLLQALFFPSRTFAKGVCSINRTAACAKDSDCSSFSPSGQTCLSSTINWIGSLQNFWYYVDPQLHNSSIMEESVETGPTYRLDLAGDKVLAFKFDGTNTLAYLYAPTGTGVAGALKDVKCLDEALNGACCKNSSDSDVKNACSSDPIGYIWEAGKILQQRTDARTIYTTTTGAVNSQDTIGNIGAATLKPFLQAADSLEAAAIMNYVSGQDVSVCSISHKDCSGSPTNCLASDGTCQAYRNRTAQLGTLAPGTWALGDIVNSTPKVASSVPLNLYHKTYLDTSYQNFINSLSYKSRGMVFAGANDGMLHAFKLGTLTIVNDNTTTKAKLAVPENNAGTPDTLPDLGKEAWAFIPKNALPYLKYLTDPNYSHLYYVDATPYIFDASIGPPGGSDISNQTTKNTDSSVWRTILIGGMRFGGASKDFGSASPFGVNAPASGAGYSSYFALDITDPNNPHVMWEKSSFDLPGLGFSTSGPAIVRINGTPSGSSSPSPQTNGRWFAVFASGPTGPIDTSSHQFKGFSDQGLKIYVLDLNKGDLLETFDAESLLGIKNAFAGSLTNAAIDFDQNDPMKPGNYSDDAVYFGYIKAETSDLTKAKWTDGGVLRLVTKDKDTNLESADPGKWKLSTVIDGVGPVTAAVTKLQNYDTNKVFLYFGTGRYYYKIADQIDDAGDSGVRRSLYGVLEPCFTSTGFDAGCTSPAGSLGDVTTSSANAGSGGWFINLDLCTKCTPDGQTCTEAACSDPGVTFKAERMVTDPLATFVGALFFTTTKPTADVCEYGGRTHIWAVQYDTGGAVKKSALQGQVLVQTSTGSIAQLDLSKAFTQKADAGAASDTVGDRRTDMIPGVPPVNSASVQTPARPMKKVVHIKER